MSKYHIDYTFTNNIMNVYKKKPKDISQKTSGENSAEIHRNYADRKNRSGQAGRLAA